MSEMDWLSTSEAWPSTRRQGSTLEHQHLLEGGSSSREIHLVMNAIMSRSSTCSIPPRAMCDCRAHGLVVDVASSHYFGHLHRRVVSCEEVGGFTWSSPQIPVYTASGTLLTTGSRVGFLDRSVSSSNSSTQLAPSLPTTSHLCALPPFLLIGPMLWQAGHDTTHVLDTLLSHFQHYGGINIEGIAEHVSVDTNWISATFSSVMDAKAFADNWNSAKPVGYEGVAAYVVLSIPRFDTGAFPGH